MKFIKKVICLFLIFAGWFWLLGAFCSWFIVNETTQKFDFWNSFFAFMLFLTFAYITFWLAHKLKNINDILCGDLENSLLKCPNCGYSVNQTDLFCTNCGNKLNDTTNNDIKDNTPKLTKTILSEYDNFIDEKINDFNKCLYIANQQKTHELLEVLIEFEDLDRAYLKIKNIKANFMPRNLYDETKLNILDNIISDKFRKYSSSKKNKDEKMKSLLDELYVCKRRYPEYKEILEKYITNINNIIKNN